MNQGEIDFEKIKGFKELSENAKKIFIRVYKSHNAVQGIKHKNDWMPVKVKEHKTHLEVHFKNKEWLHYMPDGTWY